MDEPDTLRTAKRALRVEVTRRLAGLAQADLLGWSRLACERLVALDVWNEATEVFCYIAMADEVETRYLLEVAVAAGKTVYLPRLADAVNRAARTMWFHLWSGPPSAGGPDGGLERHSFGMLEPAADAPRWRPSAGSWPVGAQPEAFTPENGRPALVVCPGRAFDRAGRRLGRGAGYYDRFLSGLPRGAVRAVGVCFDLQIVDSVPVDVTDEPMEMVVTESGVIRAD